MRFYTIAMVVLILFMMGCGLESNPANRAQQKQMAQALGEAEARVGPVGIVNFTERRFMKTILELRDSEVITFSYYMDLNGNLHFLCQSIGYGLPYSTQYTNPEAAQRAPGGNRYVLPQVDPNGLYGAAGVAATWIICSGEKGKPDVVYWEPDLIVSPFRLNAKTSLKATRADKS